MTFVGFQSGKSPFVGSSGPPVTRLPLSSSKSRKGIMSLGFLATSASSSEWGRSEMVSLFSLCGIANLLGFCWDSEWRVDKEVKGGRVGVRFGVYRWVTVCVQYFCHPQYGRRATQSSPWVRRLERVWHINSCRKWNLCVAWAEDGCLVVGKVNSEHLLHSSIEAMCVVLIVFRLVNYNSR